MAGIPSPSASTCHPDEASAMKFRPQEVHTGQTVSTLKLKRARVRFALQPRLMFGKVSAAFVGPKSGSIRFTFVPSGRKSANGLESLEFELTRNQAWFLAEWMTNQSIRKGPVPTKQ
jgi:hypothetical protein